MVPLKFNVTQECVNEYDCVHVQVYLHIYVRMYRVILVMSVMCNTQVL